MAREIGGVFVNWKTNVASFLSDLDKAQVKSTATGVLIANQLSKATEAMVNFAQRAVRALPDITAEAINVADGINDLAKRTGISTEALSGFRLAAEQSGTSLEGVANGLRVLGRNMNEAFHGSKQAQEGFRQLGVQWSDGNGLLRNLSAVMADVADRFQQLDDGAEKAALAQKIFGRSGTELIPLLNEGGAALKNWVDEAESMGGLITGDLAKAADLFNDNLAKLKTGVLGIGLDISKVVLPPLIALTDGFANFSTQVRQAFTGMSPAMNEFTTQMEALAEKQGPKAIEVLQKLSTMSYEELYRLNQLTQQQARAALAAKEKFKKITFTSQDFFGDLAPKFISEEELKKQNDQIAKKMAEVRESFQSALLPATALNEQLKLIAASGAATGQILAVYEDAIVKAVEAQKAHGEAVPPFITSLYAIAKATQTTKEAMESYVGTQDLATQSAELWLESMSKTAEAPVLVADALERLNDTNRRIVQEVTDKLQKVSDAYELLGLKAPAELEKLRQASEKAYNDSGLAAERGSQRELTARLNMLQTAKNAMIANGEAWTKQNEKDLAAVENQLGRFTDQTASAIVKMQDLSHTIAQGFEDAILRGNSFREVLAGILEDIGRIALRSTLTGPNGVLSGLFGAISGALGGVFGGGAAAAAAAAPAAEPLPLVGTFFAGMKMPMPEMQAFLPDGVMPLGELAPMPIEEMVGSGAVVPETNQAIVNQTFSNITINGNSADEIVSAFETIVERAHDSAVKTAINIMTEMQLRRA